MRCVFGDEAPTNQKMSDQNSDPALTASVPAVVEEQVAVSAAAPPASDCAPEEEDFNAEPEGSHGPEEEGGPPSAPPPPPPPPYEEHAVGAPPSALSLGSLGDSLGALAPSPADQQLFHLKKITFQNRLVSIVLQNENGPCPLLAVANCLLLSDHIRIHPDYSRFSGRDLMELLGDYLMKKFERNPEIPQEQLHTVVSSFPTLLEGLNVNVQFRRPSDFEYTQEMDVFDLFQVNLYHGWVIDPENSQLSEVVGSKGYNQLVEMAVEASSVLSARENGQPLPVNEEDADLVILRAELLNQFLSDSSSQLTPFGLRALRDVVKDHEMCVFFRNNHFNCMYKFRGNLYLLVTDVGFSETGAVWERFEDVSGNNTYCGYSFAPLSEMEARGIHGSVAPPPSAVNPYAEVDAFGNPIRPPQGGNRHGYPPMSSHHPASGGGGYPNPGFPASDYNMSQEERDLELARRMQLEEERRYQEAAAIQQQRQRHAQRHHAAPPGRDRNPDVYEMRSKYLRTLEKLRGDFRHQYMRQPTQEEDYELQIKAEKKCESSGGKCVLL